VRWEMTIRSIWDVARNAHSTCVGRTDNQHPPSLLQSQASYEELLGSEGEGTQVIEFFAVLRHIVSLIFAENRALEEFRKIVATKSGSVRVDIPIPYEPDVELFAYEEADVHTRSQVLIAANWLIAEWPDRFIQCCRDARVEYPALNRNSISVSSFCKATSAGYLRGMGPTSR
jgi:hypothetical protein